MLSDDKLIDVRYGDIYYITVRGADGIERDDSMTYNEYLSHQRNDWLCDLCGKGTSDATIYTGNDNIICRDCLQAVQKTIKETP